MRWRDLCKLGLQLPEVEEGTAFGVPALRVRGSLVAQALDRKRSALLKVDPALRSELCARRAETFFIPSGQENYAVVAVRLAEVGPDELWSLLAESWRRSAPPSLVAGWPGPG